jgi:hypothetical protein
MGLAATEKHPTLTGMAIYRVTGDKCVERWVQVGLYWRQLGARLAPGKVIWVIRIFWRAEVVESLGMRTVIVVSVTPEEHRFEVIVTDRYAPVARARILTMRYGSEISGRIVIS